MYDGKPEKRKFSVWATKVIKYKKFAIFYNQDKCDKIQSWILYEKFYAFYGLIVVQHWYYSDRHVVNRAQSGQKLVRIAALTTISATNGIRIQ